jgi:hypothetical protein
MSMRSVVAIALVVAVSTWITNIAGSVPLTGVVEGCPKFDDELAREPSPLPIHCTVDDDHDPIPNHDTNYRFVGWLSLSLMLHAYPLTT